MKKKIMEALMLFGVTFSVGMTLLMSATFLRAFLSPDKSVLVTVNTAGEAKLEIVMLVIIVPLTIFTLIQYYRKYLKVQK